MTNIFNIKTKYHGIEDWLRDYDESKTHMEHCNKEGIAQLKDDYIKHWYYEQYDCIMKKGTMEKIIHDYNKTVDYHKKEGNAFLCCGGTLSALLLTIAWPIGLICGGFSAIMGYNSRSIALDMKRDAEEIKYLELDLKNQEYSKRRLKEAGIIGDEP